MFRRPLSRGLFCCALVLGSLAEVAHAQTADRTFSPQLFHPAPGPDAFITVESAVPLAHKSPGVGLFIDYSRNPLSVRAFDLSTGRTASTRSNLIEHAVSAELWAGVGFIGRLQIALSVPMVLYQTGKTFSDPEPAALGGTIVPAASGFAFGDPRLYLKARLYGKDTGFQIAISHWLSVPLGRDSDFGGEKHWTGFAGEPRVLLGWQARRFRVGAVIGFRWRVNTSHFLSTVVGQQLTYAVAGAFDAVRDRLSIVAELYGHTGFDLDRRTAFFNDSPLEVSVAAKVRLPRDFGLVIGVANGVLAGLGATEPRAFVGATWIPDLRDRDHDGVSDSRDRCPDEREDHDRFEDSDGCPEPDNDRDLVLDGKDPCPNDPEDFDGFEDDDGCPELDNDRDGIIDAHDRCINDKEDGKGARPNDGCPASVLDTDEDGINDGEDKCVDEPEDLDGFDDEDGCPDVDNDGDGVPDSFDECPNQTETVNGFSDDDGCPDTAPDTTPAPPDKRRQHKRR